MKSTLKQNFDKYELLVTPVLLILLLILIIIYIPQLVIIENLNQVFLLPLALGIVSGIIINVLMDKYWKKVSQENISSFLTMPALLLILLSAIASVIATYDVYASFLLLGFGLGNMSSIISLTSLIVYFRTYFNKN